MPEKTLKKARKKRSLSFRETRKHHGTEAAEDYTELIAELTERTGEARTCEIARHLGISHVTAIRTMRRLQAEGYLETSPHQPVTLTPKGRATAQASKDRHELLVEFFVSIGVPKEVAEIDVEGVEHHVSPISLNAIRSFLQKSSGRPRGKAK